jgi:quercetin dioxygenase-like cupin family protein
MPIKRAILERFDVPDSNTETVMMLVEVPPQVNTGLHTHPGFDAAYLLEGSLTVITLGQPDRTINAGQSWHVPPGIVHTPSVRLWRRGDSWLTGQAFSISTGGPPPTWI